MSSLTRVSSATLLHSALSHRQLLCSVLVVGLLVFGGGCSGDDAPNPNAGATAGAGGSSVAQAGTSNVAGSNASAGNAGTSGGASGGSGTSGTSGMAGGSVGGAAAGSGGVGGGSGGGSAGSGTGGGSGSCAGKTYKLCEDFESGAPGALPMNWTKLKGFSSGAASEVGLATDEFHGGKSALKSSSMEKGQTRAQTSLAALGATASKHWGRIYYKVQSPAAKPSSGVLHVTFVGLMGTGENRVVDIVEDSAGKHQWLYNNPDDAGGKGSAYDWTFDAAWHCAEWYVDVSAKAYRFFSDSKEVTSIGFTGKADAQMSSYSSVIVGAEFYQIPPAPFVMWFDDLAIDDNQIGCQ